MIKYKRHTDEAVDESGRSQWYTSEEIKITGEQKTSDQKTRRNRLAGCFLLVSLLIVIGVGILILVIKRHQQLTSQEEDIDNLKTNNENSTKMLSILMQSLSETQNNLNDLNKIPLDNMQTHRTNLESNTSSLTAVTQFQTETTGYLIMPHDYANSNCASTKTFTNTFAKFEENNYHMGCNEIDRLCDGQVIEVSGTFCHATRRLTINLVGSDGIAFHFDARFNYRCEHCIMINSMMLNGKWIQQISYYGTFPFQQNERYRIRLVVNGNMLEIEANGQHFPAYTLPYGFKMKNIRKICGHVHPWCYKYNTIHLYMNNAA